MATDLPNSINAIAALGPLFAASATLVVGIMVAGIAYRQWRTANDKMVLDLFDRRLDVYSKLDKFADHLLAEKAPTRDIMKEAVDTFLRTKFLFGPEVFDRIRIFKQALEKYKTIPPETKLYDSEIEIKKAMEKQNAEALAAVQAFRDDMPEIFEKYLHLPHRVS